jgi:hypothetical protein
MQPPAYGGCAWLNTARKQAEKVERAMRERKRWHAEERPLGRRVTSRKQAIAIGLSEARAVRCRR